jgi:transcriptional repressor BetI
LASERKRNAVEGVQGRLTEPPFNTKHVAMDRSPRLPRHRRVADEETRRRELIEATIDSIAERGFGGTTVAEIARRAGTSVGLVAFYFMDKDGLLEATMLRLAADLRAAQLERLAAAGQDPRRRLVAVVEANLDPCQFERRIVAAWLAFWAQVPHAPRFQRVQRAYRQRMISNLASGFVAFVPRAQALRLAVRLAAIVDGLWLHAALSGGPPDHAEALAQALDFVDTEIALAAMLQRRAGPSGGAG